MDKVLEEQGGAGPHRGGQRWDSTPGSSWRWTRCAAAPDADVATLSGGERRRVALCRLLLKSPDLLLLDEPTNHLDAESVAWLERFLKDYPGTVVAVTHDRYFLDNVAGWILELDRGPASPGRATTRRGSSRSRTALALEEKRKSKRQRTLERELEWIRMSPRARQAKGKARLNAYEELLNEQDTAQKIDQVEIYIPPGPRLGDVVVEARGVRKGYGDLLLIDDLNFTLPRGGIVGVIGPNGAGKTTLFRMITGQEQPDGGRRCGSARRCSSATSTSRATRSTRQERVGGDHRRPTTWWNSASARWPRARTCRGSTSRARPAAQGRRTVGRRAQPRAPRQAAAGGGEPAAARRADQRPRRRHAARARGGAAQLRRLRGGHQPRPLVPRPHRDAHPRLRGRQPASSGSRGTTRTTRPIATAASAPKPTSRTGSSTDEARRGAWPPGRHAGRRPRRARGVRRRAGAGGEPRGAVCQLHPRRHAGARGLHIRRRAQGTNGLDGRRGERHRGHRVPRAARGRARPRSRRAAAESRRVGVGGRPEGRQGRRVLLERGLADGRDPGSDAHLRRHRPPVPTGDLVPALRREFGDLYFPLEIPAGAYPRISEPCRSWASRTFWSSTGRCPSNSRTTSPACCTNSRTNLPRSTPRPATSRSRGPWWDRLRNCIPGQHATTANGPWRLVSRTRGPSGPNRFSPSRA
jgi:ABC-type multidrug transport system ATPase subunit